MSTDERRPEERNVSPVTGSPEDVTAVVAARDAGDDFLRAADEAIDRALSNTPEAFLRQNRQLGGQ